jgi:hypothetical protein
MSILDEAIRAGCDGLRCHYPGCAHCGWPELVTTALRTAIPREPTPETIEAMAVSLCCGKEHCNAADHAPDHDLSDDGYATRYGCESKEQQDAALAAYRAQPIWQALWGEEA